MWGKMVCNIQYAMGKDGIIYVGKDGTIYMGKDGMIYMGKMV